MPNAFSYKANDCRIEHRFAHQSLSSTGLYDFSESEWKTGDYTGAAYNFLKHFAIMLEFDEGHRIKNEIRAGGSARSEEQFEDRYRRGDAATFRRTISQATDVTEKKQAELALFQMAAIVKSSDDGMVELNP